MPHYDNYEMLQSVTFRLADSLPQNVLRNLELELNGKCADDNELEKNKRIEIEKWLDSGKGCCALANSKMAAVMQDALLKFDGERYDLIAWCIMPNHVHVLINQKYPLGRIVQSWKSYTGRYGLKHNAELELGVPGGGGLKHNAELELGVPGRGGGTGRFWMREYWDRYIRDERHLYSVIEYIQNNPVKAGLCKTACDWQWSSAGYWKVFG